MPDLSLRRANSLSHLAQGARKVPEGSLTILPDAAKLIFRGRSLAVQAVENRRQFRAARDDVDRNPGSCLQGIERHSDAWRLHSRRTCLASWHSPPG